MINHIKTEYGKDLVGKEISNIKSYVLITMEIAWDICKDTFKKNPPDKIVYIETLDKVELDKMNEKLPQGLKIIGLGGGAVLDAAKYIAYLQNSEPLLIPTISSTDGPFSDFMSLRKHGTTFGFKVDGYPKKVLVDYELIKKSDPRYNLAGYGDLLSLQTTLNDWLIASQYEGGNPVNLEIQHEIERTINSATAHAKEIGILSESGVFLLMESLQFLSELYIKNPEMPISAGSDHLFAWNLESVTGKTYLHGEIVALGTVISSYLQSDYLSDTRHLIIRKALDEAQVNYQPETLGISWREIEDTLLSVEKYNNKDRHFNTVYKYIEWTPEVLLKLKKYLFESIS